MAKRSDAWKDLERAIAIEARKVGFTRAFRVCRGDDIGVSAVDVILPEIPFVKIDTKYQGKGWHHHTLIREGEAKYCQNPGDFMILPTKGGHERGSFCTLRTEVLMTLLADKFLNTGRPEYTLGCPRCNAIAIPKRIGLNLSECTCEACGLAYFIRSEDVPAGADEPLYHHKDAHDIYEHPLEILVSDKDCQPQVQPKKRRKKKDS